MPRPLRLTAILWLFFICLAVRAADLPPEAVVRLGSAAFRHGGAARCVDYAPDGKTIASGGTDDVCLWDAATGERLRDWPVPRGARKVKFSPDGKKLAAGCDDKTLRVWNLSTGQLLFARTVLRDYSGCFAWTGEDLMIGGLGRNASSPETPVAIRLNGTTGKEDTNFVLLGDSVVGAAACPTTGQVLFAGSDGSVNVINPADVKAESSFRLTFECRAESLAVAPNGTWFAVAGRREPGKSAILLFSVEDRIQLSTFPTRTLAQALAVSADSKSIAASEPDGHIRVWDIPTGQERVALHAGSPDVNALAFSPDGKWLVSTDSRPRLRFWNLEQSRERDPPPGHLRAVTTLMFRAGNRLITGGDDQAFRVWDIATGKVLHQWETDSLSSDCVAPAPDGRSLLIVKAGDVLRWEPGVNREISRVFEMPLKQPNRPALSPNGRLVHAYDLTDTYNWRRRVFEVATGRELAVPPNYRLSSDWLLFSADRRYAARHTDDRKSNLVITNLTTGNALTVADSANVSKAATPPLFAPSSRLLVLASSATGLRLLELPTLVVRRQQQVWNDCTAIAFAPDGRTLVVGTTIGALRLYDIPTGTESGPFVAHRGPIRALAFSADGSRLASGAAETTAVVWDFAKLRPMLPAVATPTVAQLDAAWNDLGSADGKIADAAAWLLARAGEPAVALLKQRVQPVTMPDAATLTGLIAELGAERFDVRRKASAALAALGPDAKPALKAAREKEANREVQYRIDELLARPAGFTPAKLRPLRAGEVLERIATPAARQLLADLAAKSTDTEIKPELDWALKRLAGREQ
ncbi:MAG: hypothetical protein ACJ8F7_05870 [Gemmataceae bacterium]